MEKEVRRDPVRFKAYVDLGTSFALYVPLFYSDKFQLTGGALTWSGKIFLPKDIQYPKKKWVFEHELLHHMFKHLERGVGHNPMLWNIAADHVVHVMMDSLRLVDKWELRQNGFLLLDGAPDGPVEVVYRWLMNKVQDQLSKGLTRFRVGGLTFEVVKEPSPGGPGEVDWEDGQGNKGKVYIPKPDERSTEGSGTAREEFDRRMKSRGDLPAGLKREFEKADSTGVNWKQYVQQKIASVIGSRSRDFTYTKIPFFSRAVLRRGIRIPGSIKKYTCLGVAIDTSGSISRRELSLFLRGVEELRRIVNDLYVWVVDAEVHHFYHNPSFPFEVSGGGGCVGPGAEVLTTQGYKKIEEIKKGDLVFSHDGKVRRVLETYENVGDHRPCYRVRSSLGQEIVLTCNHPLFVFQPRGCRFDRSSPCLPGRKSKYCEQCTQPMKPRRYGWMTVEEMYREKSCYPYFAVLPILEVGCGGTYDDGYMVGYFIGDGWTGRARRTMRIEFYVPLDSNPEKLLSALSKVTHVYEVRSRDTKRICATNLELGKRLAKLKYGGGILNEVLSRGREWCEGFIDGLTDADGYYVQGKKHRKRVQLSDRMFVDALVLACYKTGRLCSISPFQQPERGFGCNKKPAWLVTISEPTAKGSRTYTDGRVMFTRIVELSPCENPGVTYNLKVEGSESYLLRHIGSHNTDFRPVFDDIREKKLPITMLVFFTDTYGAFPDYIPPYPVLWVVVETEFTLDPKVPFGSVILI